MDQVQFPIVLLSKDCAETHVFENLDELEQVIEEIDVENQEYVGWDGLGYRLALRAKSEPQESHWLHIERSSETPEPDIMRKYVEQFASSIRCPLHLRGGESVVEFATRVDNWNTDQKWLDRPLWRRILGLPNP